MNLKTGREWLFNPGARDQTASIIKADILETLLYQTRSDDDSIADAEGEIPEGMIEASDNADATRLWDQIGGAAGISRYNKLAGLTQTTPNTQGYWGETLTSAADQIKLLELLAKPSKLLTRKAQAYQLSLMEDIDPGENWGVTGGVPGGVTVALKNGWVPLASNLDWEVNSIGWVHGDGRDYLIAVLTAHDPSEAYGIDTIQKISASVYATLGADRVRR
jgi:beta-lactamase class A